MASNGQIIHPPAISDGYSARLVENRAAFVRFLQDGSLPTGDGALAKALKAFAQALQDNRQWAVKMALEYSVGNPGDHLKACKATDGDEAPFDPTEIEESMTLTRRRRLR